MITDITGLQGVWCYELGGLLVFRLSGLLGYCWEVWEVYHRLAGAKCFYGDNLFAV